MMATLPPTLEDLQEDLIEQCRVLTAYCAELVHENRRVTAERDELQARVKRLELERAQVRSLVNGRISHPDPVRMDSAVMQIERPANLSPLPTTQPLILSILHEARERGGDASWVSARDLFSRIDRSTSTIRSALKKLQEKGKIEAIEAPRTITRGVPPKAYALAGTPMPSWYVVQKDLCAEARAVFDSLTGSPKTALAVRSDTLLSSEAVNKHLQTLSRLGLAKRADGAWRRV